MKEESSALGGSSLVPWARGEPRLALPPHCSLPYSWVTITLAPICLYLSVYPVSGGSEELESCEKVSMLHRHWYHVLQVHEHTDKHMCTQDPWSETEHGKHQCEPSQHSQCNMVSSQTQTACFSFKNKPPLLRSVHDCVYPRGQSPTFSLYIWGN